ncbi:MAG: DUF5671 domain-containing protein, partial [Leptolinea sp.]
MRTIRRLYFYLVAFIGLEVILWSIITLARTLFDAATLANIGDQISGGLAFLIVGLPIFLFHWIIVQRDAARDTEERSSRLREIFLYGVVLATLIPIAQNIIALINRPFLALFELDNTFAFLGSQQTILDNLVAILVLGVIFAYFYKIVQIEWVANTPGNDLSGTRRLFRYIWMLYSLVLLVIGANNILQYILFTPSGFGNPTRELLANGLAVVLVSTPLWTVNWLTIQRSLPNQGERGSYLRLVVLYLLALAGIITTLFSAGWVIADVLKSVLQQEGISAVDLINRISSTLAIAIPMGVIWAYFGREWNIEIDQVTDPLGRSALRRLYFYILALLGNISVFFGIQMLIGVVIDILLGQSTGLGNFSGSLSSAIAMLAVGLPLWMRYWPGLQAEAAQVTESGDHARRSIIRKSYLYLALFSLVVGLMASAGMLLYHIFSFVMVQQADIPLMDILHDFKTLSIVIVWLVYHFMALRGDGKAAQIALANQHASFPVAILREEQTDVSDAIIENLKRTAPSIPALILPLESLSTIDLNTYKAVVLPVSLITNLQEPLQSKLQDFTGKRLILPVEKEGWLWQGIIQRGKLDSAKETARIIRLLAEGQTIQPAPSNNPWVIIGYIFGGIFALQVVF